MNIRTSLAALAFCFASTVTFAATPTSTPTAPGTPANSKPGSATHCAKGYVLQNGKCVAKNKIKTQN